MLCDGMFCRGGDKPQASPDEPAQVGGEEPAGVTTGYVPENVRIMRETDCFSANTDSRVQIKV